MNKQVPSPAPERPGLAPGLASLSLEMASQPDGTTCGPTCLHAVYRYFGDELPLGQLIGEIEPLSSGGTLAVTLANHALRRGYSCTIHTYNLQLFDPTWFRDGSDLRVRLRAQQQYRKGDRFRSSSNAYLEYLDLGGRVVLGVRPSVLIRTNLKKELPILAGVSSTHLYGCSREHDDEADSVRGRPTGHFVVLSGYDSKRRRVAVADPLHDNPGFGTARYEVDVETLVCSIMLGVITYDANLLVIRPRSIKESCDDGTLPKASPD